MLRIQNNYIVLVKTVETLVGYNANYRDKISLLDVKFTGKHVCRMHEGNNEGKEAKVLGYKCESTSISRCFCN